MSSKAGLTRKIPLRGRRNPSTTPESGTRSTSPRRAPLPKRPGKPLPGSQNRGVPHFHRGIRSDASGPGGVVGGEAFQRTVAGTPRNSSPPHLEVERSVGYLSCASRDGDGMAIGSGSLRLSTTSRPVSASGRESRSPGRLSERSASRETAAGWDGGAAEETVLHEVEPPSYVVGHAILNPFVPVAPPVQPLVQIVATSLPLPSAAVRPLRGGALRFPDEKHPLWLLEKGKKPHTAEAATGRNGMETYAQSYPIEKLFAPETVTNVMGNAERGTMVETKEAQGLLRDTEGISGKEEMAYAPYELGSGVRTSAKGTLLLTETPKPREGVRTSLAVLPGLEGVVFTAGENLLCVEAVGNALDIPRPTVASMTLSGCGPTSSSRKEHTTSVMDGGEPIPPQVLLDSTRSSMRRLQALYHTTPNDVPVVFQGTSASATPFTAGRVLPVLLRAEERVAELAAKRRVVDWDISIPTAETIPPPAIAFLDSEQRPVPGLQSLVFTLDAQTLRFTREDTHAAISAEKECEEDRKGHSKVSSIPRGGTTTMASPLSSHTKGHSPSPPTSANNRYQPLVVGGGSFPLSGWTAGSKPNPSTVGTSISYEDGVHRIHGLVGVLPGLAERVGLDRVMEYELETTSNELFVAAPYVDSEVGDLVLQLNATIQGTQKLLIRGYDCGSVDTQGDKVTVQKSVNALELSIKVQYAREMGVRPVPSVGVESVAAFQRCRRGDGVDLLAPLSAGLSFPRADITDEEEGGSSFVFSATNPHELRYEECRQATREYIAMKTTPVSAASTPSLPRSPRAPSVPGGEAASSGFAGGGGGGGLAGIKLGEEGSIGGGTRDPPTMWSVPAADSSTRLTCGNTWMSMTPTRNKRSSVNSFMNSSSRSRSPRGLTVSPNEDNGTVSPSTAEGLGTGDFFSSGRLDSMRHHPVTSSMLGIQGQGPASRPSSSVNSATSMKALRKDMVGAETQPFLEDLPASTPTAGAAALADQLQSLQRLPSNIGPCECMSTSIAFQLSHAGQLLYFFYLPRWHARLASLLHTPKKEDEEAWEGEKEWDSTDVLFPSVSSEARATQDLFTSPDHEKKREVYVEWVREELRPILQDIVYAEVPIDVSLLSEEDTSMLATSEHTMALLRDLILVLALEHEHKRCYRYHELVTLCHRLYHSARMKTIFATRGNLESIEKLAQWAITPEEERPAECWRSPLFPNGKLTLRDTERHYLQVLDNILRATMWVSFHIGAFKEGIFYATQRVYILCILNDGVTTEVCLAQRYLAEHYAVFGDYFTAQQLSMDVVALSEKLYDVDAPEVVEAQILSVICHFCANMVEDGVAQLHELYEYYLHRRAGLSPRLSSYILLLVLYSQSTCSLFSQHYPALVLDDNVARIDDAIRLAGGEYYLRKGGLLPSPPSSSSRPGGEGSPLSGSNTRLYSSKPSGKGRKGTKDFVEGGLKREDLSGMRTPGRPRSSLTAGTSMPSRGGAAATGGNVWLSNNFAKSKGSAVGAGLVRGARPSHHPKGGAGGGGERLGKRDDASGEEKVVELETEKDPSASAHLRTVLLALCGNLLIRAGAHTRGLQLLSKVFLSFWELLPPPALAPAHPVAMVERKSDLSPRGRAEGCSFSEDLKGSMRRNSRHKTGTQPSPGISFPSFSLVTRPSLDQELSTQGIKEEKIKASSLRDRAGAPPPLPPPQFTDALPSARDRAKGEKEGAEDEGLGTAGNAAVARKEGEAKEHVLGKGQRSSLSSSSPFHPTEGGLIAARRSSSGNGEDVGRPFAGLVTPHTEGQGGENDDPLLTPMHDPPPRSQENPKDPFGFGARLLWWMSSEMAVWRFWSQPSSWKESVDMLKQSAAGMEEAWGPNHPFSAVVALLLAQSLQNSPHSNALRMAQRSLAVFRRGVSPRSKYFLLVHRTLSRLYTLEHLWKEALEHSNAALILGQLNFSTDDIMCQIEEDFLGCLLRCPPGTSIRLDQNLLLQRLQDRVTHLESIYGLHSELLVWPLVNLADAYYILRDMDAALTCLQRAVRLTDPKGALLVTSATLKPSTFLPNKDEVQRRNLVISTVLQTRERILQLSQVLFTMAGVLEATGNIADAQDCYCRCLGLLEAAGMERSLSAIRIYTAISKLLYSSKEYGDSLGWARKAERFTHSHYPEWVHERQLTKSLLAIVEHRLYTEEGTYVTVNPRNYYLEDFVELI